MRTVKTMSHVLHSHGLSWSYAYLWMILGVLAGPDSGVVGGPAYIRDHVGQSLGAVLEREMRNVKTMSHVFHSK